MTKSEQLNALEQRQLELLGIMSESDTYAVKCAKLGVKFATTYPEKKAAYVAANTEYNENQTRIEALKAEIEGEVENVEEEGI